MAKKKKKHDEELSPYHIDKLSRYAPLPKVLFMKWWFAGCIYYLTGFGLNILNIGAIENAIVVGLVIGLMNEYVVKNVIKMMSNSKARLEDHIEVNSSYTKGLLLNILFGIVIALFIAYTYNFINIACINIFDLPKDRVVLPAEPFTFGLFYLGYDYIYIGLRKIIRKK